MTEVFFGRKVFQEMNDAYIHPNDERVKQWMDDLHLEEKELKDVIQTIFAWFDEYITYSRLNAPWYPLQRSDLDVLEMLAGTCGDYSNLIVSVLTALHYEVRYAYVRTDCYRNPQDHICAAVWDENEWKLIDATLPYRKWKGFPCLHIEYELLTVEKFFDRMKKEEAYWTQKAVQSGNEAYSGLFYAPWIHNDIVVNTEDTLECVFYLLVIESKENYQVYVNYLVYSEEKAFSPIMCRAEKDTLYFSFSEKTAQHIWDNGQWGNECLAEDVPEKHKTGYYEKIRKSIGVNLPHIKRILSDT